MKTKEKASNRIEDHSFGKTQKKKIIGFLSSETHKLHAHTETQTHRIRLARADNVISPPHVFLPILSFFSIHFNEWISNVECYKYK